MNEDPKNPLAIGSGIPTASDTSGPAASPAAAITCDQNQIRMPPAFCQYADDPCDQRFDATLKSSGLFLYASEPSVIAGTVEQAKINLERLRSSENWLSWHDLRVEGKIIFCRICQAIRYTDTVIADVTTLNFNLMFEIGYALGLELPVVPIKDTSYISDKTVFERLGLLDTLGYTDFQNAEQLAKAIEARLPLDAIPIPPTEINLQAPLYVLKGPHETEGDVRLFSAIKKSSVFFRAWDVVETPRRSLHEVRKQVAASLGVVTHLLSPNREGALVHNARCALVAGMALAQGKNVLMLQEEHVEQPIDYRDVVVSYRSPDQIEALLRPGLLRIIKQLQSRTLRSLKAPSGLLQKLDLGDLAAENEIRPLQSYFVPTGHYQQARKGHARLVVGRKGGGKTAIFYGVRDSLGKHRARLILDLMPEGHQFTRLESRAARPPRRDELSAARTLDARVIGRPRGSGVVHVYPREPPQGSCRLPVPKTAPQAVMPLAQWRFAPLCTPPQGRLRHIVPLALVPHTRHERRRQPCPATADTLCYSSPQPGLSTTESSRSISSASNSL